MNYININIGGKERGCKLGLGFLERVQKEENVTLEDIFNKVNTATLLFHSLAYNCERTKEERLFDKYDVYDWIDEIGLNNNTIIDFQIAFFNSFKTHLDENGNKSMETIVKELEGKKSPQKKVAVRK